MKLTKDYKYFNAGVVLYNLEKMRKMSFTKAIFQRLEDIKKPIYQDQDVLNSLASLWQSKFNVYYKSIDSRYNQAWFPDTIKSIYRDKICRFISQQSFLPLFIRKFFLNKQCAFIIHYIGGDKPWKDKKRRGTMIYKEYVNSKYTPNKFKKKILKNM